jgi:predicted PurR-regulated permease PerM
MNMTILLGLIISLIATAATVIGAVYAFLRNFKIDLNGHISRLERDINNLGNKVDKDINNLTNKVDAETKAQTARTDQLYQVIIDLLKDRKRTDP